MFDLLLNFDLLSCQRFFKADKMNGWFWEWRYFNDIKRTTNNFWYPKAKMKFDIEIKLKPNQQKAIKAALKTFKAYSIKISSKTPPQYHHTWLPLKSNFIPFKLITSTREEKKNFQESLKFIQDIIKYQLSYSTKLVYFKISKYGLFKRIFLYA